MKEIRTITMKEIKEMECESFAKKDNSVRGICTVYKTELNVGDKIVLNNYFVQIIA